MSLESLTRRQFLKSPAIIAAMPTNHEPQQNLPEIPMYQVASGRKLSPISPGYTTSWNSIPTEPGNPAEELLAVRDITHLTGPDGPLLINLANQDLPLSQLQSHDPLRALEIQHRDEGTIDPARLEWFLIAKPANQASDPETPYRLYYYIRNHQEDISLNPVKERILPIQEIHFTTTDEERITFGFDLNSVVKVLDTKSLGALVSASGAAKIVYPDNSQETRFGIAFLADINEEDGSFEGFDLFAPQELGYYHLTTLHQNNKEFAVMAYQMSINGQNGIHYMDSELTRNPYKDIRLIHIQDLDEHQLLLENTLSTGITEDGLATVAYGIRTYAIGEIDDKIVFNRVGGPYSHGKHKPGKQEIALGKDQQIKHLKWFSDRDKIPWAVVVVQDTNTSQYKIRLFKQESDGIISEPNPPMLLSGAFNSELRMNVDEALAIGGRRPRLVIRSGNDIMVGEIEGLKTSFQVYLPNIRLSPTQIAFGTIKKVIDHRNNRLNQDNDEAEKTQPQEDKPDSQPKIANNSTTTNQPYKEVRISGNAWTGDDGYITFIKDHILLLSRDRHTGNVFPVVKCQNTHD